MQKIISLIKNASKIAILGHINEDADSVGTSLAAKCVFEGMGKKADLFFSGPLENRLNFINTKDAIFFDGNFNADYDLCFCVDCGAVERLGERQAIFNSCPHTISVDHHMTNTNFAEENYVLPDASSAGEVIFDVFCELGVTLSKEIAEYLFIAIASDSGSFKYSSVSPKTMQITAKLLECSIDNAYISRMLFDTEPKAVMQFNGYIMSQIETFSDDKVSIIAVDKDCFNRFGVLEKDTGDIVNIARKVAGCEVAVSIRELDDRIKLSFRSNSIDSAKIAGQFGGGGHKYASGATLIGADFAEVKEQVIKACCEAVK